MQENPQKPYISCEYMHAMGNSCGGLKLYTELAEKYELYQGGFIWDYIDQAMFRVNDLGEDFLAMFSKVEGGMISLQYHGVEYITRTPKTSYRRACTDNDRGAKHGIVRGQWFGTGLFQRLLDVQVEETE